MTRRLAVAALSAMLALGFLSSLLHATRGGARRSGYIVASS
jgi:hypothetical protein